jgi:tRNA (guanine-N7-)-methyltransferase
MTADPKPPARTRPPEAFVLDPFAIAGQVDFAAVFGNDNPVEVEIGCGKGGFVLGQARARADRNYVGIEWANKYYKFAADRMWRWQMTNVRVIRTDAADFIANQTPPACLDAVHVYHPDPWPKARHHRRRLFQPAFVDALLRTMRPGARLAVQTDHAEYFEVIREVLSSRDELEPCDFADAEYGAPDARTETNFEVKYLREGRDIFRLAFRHRSG